FSVWLRFWFDPSMVCRVDFSGRVSRLGWNFALPFLPQSLLVSLVNLRCRANPCLAVLGGISEHASVVSRKRAARADAGHRACGLRLCAGDTSNRLWSGGCAQRNQRGGGVTSFG